MTRRVKVAYISPSSLPSRAANAVHVALQCDGFARIGAAVTLYARRTVAEKLVFSAAVRDSYGVDVRAIRLVSFYSGRSLADSWKIAAIALIDFLRSGWPDVILSRNLYASFVLAKLLRRRLLFETHQLEMGFRKVMQRTIMLSPQVTTILISESLVLCLTEHHGIAPRRSVVLHDAAPDGISPVKTSERREVLKSLTEAAAGNWDAVCGYFGQLYYGRGIEIIEAMAIARPKCLFLLYGGNDADVQVRTVANKCENLHYMGYVAHTQASRVMKCVDVLLMPYQERLSIGVAGHDTARWMSPMKMFEYLAAGVPVISSDLPVLREVLRDGVNCLLAPPAAPDMWLAALDRLIADPALAESIGANAHEEYRASRTWTRRAERLLAEAQSL